MYNMNNTVKERPEHANIKSRSGTDDRDCEKLINDSLYILERYADQKVYQLYRDGIKYISKSEIISAGYEGLYKAAIKFDAARNDNFNGFAWYYIDLAFKSYLRNLDELHHVTRRKLRDIKKTTDQLTQKLGRQPTDSEIAECLKISEKQLRKYKNININHIQSVPESNGYIGSIEVDNRADYHLENSDRNLGRDMNDCLEISVSADQRRIIELMYLDNLKAEEIAHQLWGRFTKTEKNYIYNTLKTGRKKLKKCMEEKGWSITDV